MKNSYSEWFSSYICNECNNECGLSTLTCPECGCDIIPRKNIRYVYVPQFQLFGVTIIRKIVGIETRDYKGNVYLL